jgi:general secretion pathway protein A
MYARHFGLKNDPFSIAPDPRFLFMSERHREALAHLLFGVSGTGGFVLFTGDIGTGKTTVCRCFLEQIPEACQVAMVFNPKLSALELLQTICQEFHLVVDADAGAASLKTYIDALNVFLLQSHATGHSSVLIIDEAQNLQPEVLEQLRLLTNLETYERKLLHIVLIGQPELRTMLQRHELEQLAQRVIARYHLESLGLVDTARYVQHRMEVAGHSGPLPFDEKSLRRIFKLTRGVPRRINLLCGRVLLGAWANGAYLVDSSMVNKAAAEVFDAGLGRSWMRRAWVLPLLGTLGVLGLVAVGLQSWPLVAANAPAVSYEQATPVVPVAVASATTTAERVAAVSPAPVAIAAVPPPRPLEDLESLLPQLAPDLAQAWRVLGPTWKLDFGSGDPCTSPALQPWQCYRGSELTMPLLRQLDRPGILTLQNGKQAPVYAVLTGLNDHKAVLQWGGAAHDISLMSLARFWHGEFATLWQPPPGYLPTQSIDLASPAWGLLSRQLTLLEGRTPAVRGGGAPASDATLAARVQAFQVGQGLKPDGHAGPMTFMQLEKALGGKGPSLESGAR